MKKQLWKIDYGFLLKCADVFGSMTEGWQCYYSSRPFEFVKMCLEADREWQQLKSSKAASHFWRRLKI